MANGSKFCILAGLLGYFCFEKVEGAITYGDEFDVYDTSTISKSTKTYCFGFYSCGSVDTITITGSYSGVSLLCGGTRSCLDGDTISTSQTIRANGYMGLTGSGTVSSDTEISCWAEVKFNFLVLIYTYFSK